MPGASYAPTPGQGTGSKSGTFDSFKHWLFGGDTNALVPKDMQGLRNQNIDLLSAFLQPGAFDAGGKGANYFFGGGVNGISQFLNQPSPEMRTYDTARPVLEGMLTGTGPQFERDITAANTQGSRFGSANAILRGEALRNLFNQRTQTASTLGALAGQAGSSQFDRMFQVQNQRLQLLAGLLGMSGQATLSAPVEHNDGHLGDILKLIATFAGRGGATASAAGGRSGATPQPTLMNQPFTFNG